MPGSPGTSRTSFGTNFYNTTHDANVPILTGLRNSLIVSAACAALSVYFSALTAYAIYAYTQYTGDRSYLDQYGIDVLLGIARFWAGRVHYSKRANQYMIHGVTGPNEYENNVNNNWYTNRMTAWELAYTAEQLMLIPREKAQTLGVNAEEIRRFREISEKMYLPYDEELGVFVQHDTFLD